MIIVGYQGIGKSTLARNGNGYIDLESGNFYADGRRQDDWYVVYCQIADHLSAQGYKVFVSSHAAVRERLRQTSKERIAIAFPALGIKDQWIEKLRKRWEGTGNEKDFRAYKNAEEKYEENISELLDEEGLDRIILNSMEYDLRKIIEDYCNTASCIQVEMP